MIQYHLLEEIGHTYQWLAGLYSATSQQPIALAWVSVESRPDSVCEVMFEDVIVAEGQAQKNKIASDLFNECRIKWPEIRRR